MEPRSARDWISLVCDDGWSEIDFDDVVSRDPLRFPGYAAQLEQARRSTGCTESVVVADATIDGMRALVIAFEFGFLGGSMGEATGERICRTFELGARQGVPVIALTASGGARMQEGMYALAQMPATVRARDELARAHQPFIAYLRNPTTGGVFASFANTADIVWAQPGATIGFAGPRVAESVTREPLPAGSHTAEGALDAGSVDDIVEVAGSRSRLATVLAMLVHRDAPATPERTSWNPDDAREAAGLDVMRDPRRPTGVFYVKAPIELRRGAAPDPTLSTAIARFGGTTTVTIAHDRHAATGRQTPAAFRRARAAIDTAVRLNLPIVTLIDTPGAEPGAIAERDGVAREIALTFDALLRAPVPTVACVVGEGGSGGALALAATDEVLFMTNAMFSVIAPEGAAAILRRDDVDAIVEELRLRSHTFPVASGEKITLIPEPPGGAQGDPEGARAMVERAIASAIGFAQDAPTDRRYQRWRFPS